MEIKFKECYCFDDVLLEPKYSEVLSRSDVDLSVDLGKGLKLYYPFISSPMDTITEDEMACAMWKNGCIGILHRYNTIKEQVGLLKMCHPHKVGAAIGVTGDYLDRAAKLLNEGATFLDIDVAHGDHILVKNALNELRKRFGFDIHIMAGAIATAEALERLEDWGADSARMGIGSGSICSSRLVAASGKPLLQTILECAERKEKRNLQIKLISDGGVKNSGDAGKAMAAGADAIIIGSLIAATDETPGELVGGQLTAMGTFGGAKWYRGMSSYDSQMNWKGKSATPEGIGTLLDCKGPVKNVIEELSGGLRSCCSYSGARNLQELQQKAVFIRQTNAGREESFTHILNRK